MSPSLFPREQRAGALCLSVQQVVTLPLGDRLIAKVRTGNPIDFDVYFTVEMGVGRGRANNLDDVLLVQYLLNLWLQHPSNGGARSMARKGGAAALKLDGYFGPKTGAQIMLFQAAMIMERNAPILVDGCIDRIPGDNVFIPGVKDCIYTILGLNAEVRKLYIPENGTMLDLVAVKGFPSKLLPMIARHVMEQNFA